MNRKTSLIAASLAAALALAGCQDGADENTGDVAATGDKPTVADLEARAGDSPGKPTAPIRIDYEVIGEPRAGEPLEVNLRISTTLEGPLEVSLQPQEGLTLGATQDSTLRRESVATLDEPAGERVVVVPGGEGRFYLSVLAAVATPDGQQMRSVSIPIQVGDKPPQMTPNGELTTTGDETVISLPAKESD